MAITTTEKKTLDRLLNPLRFMDKNSINLQVRRYFTDVNGIVVDKDSVLIPANLKVQYPVYCLGEMDRQGAYRIAQLESPVKNGIDFLTNFVWGVNNPYFMGFSGVSTIQRHIAPGDIVTVFCDNNVAPTWFIWIVQHIEKISLASLLYNAMVETSITKLGKLNVESVQYFTDQITQWRTGLKVIHLDEIGNYKSDLFDPYIFRTDQSVQNSFILMKWKFPLSQYIGFTTYMRFETDSIDFVLNLKHF